MTASSSDTLISRVRDFIDQEVIPRETPRAPDPVLRSELQTAARKAGLFAPQVPLEHGGLGLSFTDQARVFEEAGRSLLGPLALNCSAPDEGNMVLLERVASAAQRERYYLPLVGGEIRSAFAMTEPPPGAGSDPAALSTTAERTTGGWVINGHKRFITGAEGAAFLIVMARTGAGLGTLFLVDADNPGVRLDRHLSTMDHAFIGGHWELSFQDCRVDDVAVLGEVDGGFAAAQVRLGPARLTHCMRWLGVARRSQEIAVDYVSGRSLFGSRLGDLGLAQGHIADNEIDIAASRALIRTAAELLDADADARQDISIAKTFVAEAVHRVVDRSLQLCGASGVSHDLPLARFAAEVRPFRIYDGPSEVHRWSIARRVLRRHHNGTRRS